MNEINLAYYEKKDWNRLLEVIDDKENMHNTWKEWNKASLKLKKKLTSQGLAVKDVIVNIDSLIMYCEIRGIKNDGKSRSQFVSKK